MRCGDFKESYIKDEVIFQSFFVKFWLALFFIFLILIPFAVDAYILYVANLIGFAIIGAVGLNILTGFTGQISLGHAAFVGVGGYTAAILMTRLNFSFWLALPCAGLVAALAGLYLDPIFGGGVKDVAPFFILVLIIMIRPYGLFGKKIIERV